MCYLYDLFFIFTLIFIIIILIWMVTCVMDVNNLEIVKGQPQVAA